MSIRERMSGNEAVAIAMRQINPDVVPAFPILHQQRYHNISLNMLQMDQ